MSQSELENSSRKNSSSGSDIAETSEKYDDIIESLEINKLRRKEKLKAIIIGAAGHQGNEYYNSFKDEFNFVALIDEDLDSLNKIYSNCNQLDCKLVKNIKYLDKTIEYDIAIICVPHYLHQSLALSLIDSKKLIIKEKPLAISINNVLELNEEMKRNSNYKLFTIVQRNYYPSFIKGKEALSSIGKIYNFSYDYELNFEQQTKGWRGVFNQSFGGVLLDMGYHIIDIIFRFFGYEQSVFALSSYCYSDMKKEKLEDSINIIAQFKNEICGNINITRHFYKKKELFTIRGEKGIIEISPDCLIIYDRKGNVLINQKYEAEKTKILKKMFESYIRNQNDEIFCKEHFKHHSNIVSFIQKVYSQIRNQNSLNDDIKY